MTDCMWDSDYSPPGRPDFAKSRGDKLIINDSFPETCRAGG